MSNDPICSAIGQAGHFFKRGSYSATYSFDEFALSKFQDELSIESAKTIRSCHLP
jgi:hypothetical protein